MAAVDADQHKSLGGQYGVRGFPTIKIFGVNKNSPEDYQGPRTASGIVDAAMGKLKSMVNDRLSGKGGSSKSGGGGKKSAVSTMPLARSVPVWWGYNTSLSAGRPQRRGGTH